MSEQTPNTPRDETPPQSSDDGATTEQPTHSSAATEEAGAVVDKVREVGGRKGPDPVRYGDWEKGGRCIDF